MFLPGLGGPGSGYAGTLKNGPMHISSDDWWNLMKAGGYGIGPYGYTLGYGIMPYSQQAQMLNQQWGLRHLGAQHHGTR